MYFSAVDCSQVEVNKHMEMGRQFLSKGQFADALSHYHAAIGLFICGYFCCGIFYRLFFTLFSCFIVIMSAVLPKFVLREKDLMFSIHCRFRSQKLPDFI